MMNEAKWEEMVDQQARAFCAHAESNPRLKELASYAYCDLTPDEQNELFRLFGYAEISFMEGEGNDWWQ